MLFCFSIHQTNQSIKLRLNKLKILNSYIGVNIFKTIFLVLFALLSIDFFFSLMQESKDIGTGNYDVLTAIMFSILVSITKIYILFPWAGLLGTLLALGDLAKHSELIVIQASSISIYRVIWSICRVSIITVCFIIMFGESIIPATETYAQQMKIFSISSGQAVQTPYGIWIKNYNEFVHIEKLQTENMIKNVTRYIFNNRSNLQEISFAKVAIKADSGWLLQDIHGTRFTKMGAEIVQKDHQYISKLFDFDIVKISNVKHLDLLSVFDLDKTIKIGEANKLDVQECRVALWKKISHPFVILVMIFLAIPFAFGPLRYSSVGFKIIIAIFVSIIFYTLNSILLPFIMLIGSPLWIATFFPIIIFLLFACFMVLRAR